MEGQIGKHKPLSTPDIQFLDRKEDELTQDAKNLHYAMNSNGYVLLDGMWKFHPEGIDGVTEDLQPHAVTFFGPGALNDRRQVPFFTRNGLNFYHLLSAFDQPQVLDLVQTLRDSDDIIAEDVLYLLGGIVEFFPKDEVLDNDEKGTVQPSLDELVDYAARMTKLADIDSSRAVATAISMYEMSAINHSWGNPLEVDAKFDRHVYLMAEAISNDTTEIVSVEDLGYSQLSRLMFFEGRMKGDEGRQIPDIEVEKATFEGFPTVGAEFHFAEEEAYNDPEFWKRLALLNMSQYQYDSYIQLSRKDEKVLEVRMNPSHHPVTIANWEHMAMILPQLSEAFFTITLRRNDEKGNFSRENREDMKLLQKLQSLCMLTYAASMKDFPDTNEKADIHFGERYLGQTIQMTNGKLELTGLWGGSKGGESGQVGMYAGYGINFIYLAGNLSLALKDPSILSDIPQEVIKSSKSLRSVFTIPQDVIAESLNSVKKRIEDSDVLMNAVEAGYRIHEKVRPERSKYNL